MNSAIKWALSILLLLASGALYADIDPQKANMLSASYRTAVENKSVDALMKLVHWDNVEDNIRRMLLTAFKEAVNRDIQSVRVAPLEQNEILEYERNGVTYGPNLEPVARLHVAFKRSTGDNYQVTESSYLVGESNGRYMIATSAPMKR